MTATKVSLVASAQAAPAPKAKTAAPKAAPGPKKPVANAKPTDAGVPTWQPTAWPYGTGEKVTWDLSYGFIRGGVATLSVEPFKMIDGAPALHYRGTVKSTGMLELFYKVDNEIDSYVRLEDHLPLRQEIRQLESKRWGRRLIVFDQSTKRSNFFQSLTKPGGKTEETRKKAKMLNYGQDLFGAIFFFRFIDPRKPMNFPIHDRWKNWANELKLVGEESVTVEAGTFNALHYKMYARVTGTLKPKGDVDVWVSNDAQHLLLKFKAKIKLGAVTGEVSKIELGRTIARPVPKFKTPIWLPRAGDLDDDGIPDDVPATKTKPPRSAHR